MRRWVVAAVVLAVWLGIVGTVAAHHEPWRDEADGWLAARDASPAELLQYTRHGGTPALWHLLMMPLARGGAPYGSMTALHVAVAAATVLLIVLAAPLPLAVRVVLPFSYYFAYEYAVIARSYALSALLLFGIAALYRRRFERPVAYGVLVALLANTNVHSLVVAALIGVGYLLDHAPHPAFGHPLPADAGRGTTGSLAPRSGERVREAGVRGLALVIMLIGGLAAVAQAWPAPDAMVAGAVSTFRPESVPAALAWSVLPMLPIPLALGSVAGGAVLLAVAIAVRRTRGVLLILLGSLAAFAYIFVLKWVDGPRHFGLVLLLAVFALWAGWEERSMAHRVAAALLGVTALAAILPAYAFWRHDIAEAFSGAEEMAGYIRVHGFADRTIAAHSETAASALCPYFRRPFWFAGIEADGTYSKWDGAFSRGLEVNYSEAVRRVEAHFPDRSRVLLLLNLEMPNPDGNGWRLLYANRRPQFINLDERYWLYEAARPQ